MVQINFAQKQVNAKIVYYGPGMSGKTTNLEVIHQRAPEGNRGDLTSISTDGDRTLFFDFMPLDLGTVAGMRTCFQIYTVPGQVYYNSTRKLVLQGVDGVIFVADSSPDMMQENIESMRNLEANLVEYGRSIDDLPLVIQYNKRDIPGALPIEELEEQLNTRGVPAFEGMANTGQGVFPTLKAVAACVLESLHKQPSSEGTGAAVQPMAEVAQPAAQPADPPQRATISMSQTGFHRAPSIPLSKPEPVVAEAMDAVQAGHPTPEPAPSASEPTGGLRMAPHPQLRRQSQQPPQQPHPQAGAPAGGGLKMAPPSGSTPVRKVDPGRAQPSAPLHSPPPRQQQQQPPARAQAASPVVAVAQEVSAPKQQSPVSSMMRTESSSSVPQRRAPTSRSFPQRSTAPPTSLPRPTPQGEKSKRSVVLTGIIIVVSVAAGAALGSFVLSIL